MASLSDVAKAAGVSLTTASLVLNRPKQPNRVSVACAQRVREIAQQLGYIPNYHARSMKSGRAETIVVAIDMASEEESRVSELADAYYNQLIGGIEQHLRKVGYQMTLVGPDAFARAPERGLAGIGQRRFDGMIIPGVTVADQRSQVVAQSPDSPIVVVEHPGPTQLPVVDYDEQHGIELAIDHLAALGHKRVLWVGPISEQGGEHPRERMFAASAARAGLQTSICRFGHVPWKYVRSSMVTEAHEALARQLAQGRRDFTAIVAYNDPVAIGAITALNEVGLKVPADVSVVGFDDIEAAFCIPLLTSVSHVLPEMGRRAAELMMQMIGNDQTRAALRGTRELIQPNLIIRKSTAAPRSKP